MSGRSSRRSSRTAAGATRACGTAGRSASASRTASLCGRRALHRLGNCTLVCSQHAKAYLSGLGRTDWLLEGGRPRGRAPGAVLPAGFGVPAGQVVGRLQGGRVRLRRGGRTRRRPRERRLPPSTCRPIPRACHIATACPRWPSTCAMYHPELVDRLVPIVSPMIAAAMAVKQLYGDDVRCVVRRSLRREEGGGARPAAGEGDRRGAHCCRRLTGFWPPRSRPGQAAEPSGRARRRRARVFRCLAACSRAPAGPRPARPGRTGRQRPRRDDRGARQPGRGRHRKMLLVEALMCRGCYCGPGISSTEPGLLRKRRVGDTWPSVAGARPKRRSAAPPTNRGRAARRPFPGLDLRRVYTPDDQRLPSRARWRSARSSRAPTSFIRGRAQLRRRGYRPAAPRRSPCTAAWLRTPCACRS